MKKFLLIPLAIILIAGLCIGTGCGPSGPVAGTTIRVAVPDLGGGTESTDPINVESLWGWMYYDSLLRWDENGNLIPGVADEWSLDVDTSTWTFKIHEGITFHNGDPLTAYDVKFSVDRFSDMTQSSNPWSFYLSTLYNQVETRVVDDYTFEFVQDHPEPSQIVIFAWVRILPKDYYEEVGMDEFRAHPIGSGPWKFKELISNQECTLEANTDYWREDEIPYFQYYKEIEVPELATRIAMLKTGDVDMAAIDYDRIPDLLDDGFAIQEFLPPGTCTLCFQGTWLPGAGATSDIRVRKAMSFALNRQEICDTWFSGYAEPGVQFYMYPGCFGWDDALAADPYDPDEARALLADAGYPDAFDDPTVNVYCTAFADLSGGQDFFLLLMSYWEAVGLEVELHILDSSIWTNTMFNFERIQEGWENVGWVFCWNYSAFFNATYQSTNMYNSWGVHNCGNDPTADELYLKYANETDPELSAQYFAEFQVYVKSLYVNFGVANAKQLVVYNPDTIGGWASNARTWVSQWDSMNGVLQP
jgi:peptide/nickel transport system substrate-binding protein